ncbi:MAG: GmrSD restriction endonuclease domain-containing protein, partial [Gemmatimonadales bacterium]
PENIDISDTPPREYVPKIRTRFPNSDEWHAMHDLHALPDGWEQMDYVTFLEERRKLMAGVTRRGFETLR